MHNFKDPSLPAMHTTECIVPPQPRRPPRAAAARVLRVRCADASHAVGVSKGFSDMPSTALFASTPIVWRQCELRSWSARPDARASLRQSSNESPVLSNESGSISGSTCSADALGLGLHGATQSCVFHSPTRHVTQRVALILCPDPPSRRGRRALLLMEERRPL